MPSVLNGKMRTPNVEIEVLCHHLSGLKEGEFVSYGALSKLVRLDLTEPKNRGLLTRATARASRQVKAYYKVVIGEGIRRGTAKDYVDKMEADRASTRKKLRKSIQVTKYMSAEQYASLSPQEQKQLDTSRYAVALAGVVVGPKMAKTLAPVVTSNHELPLAGIAAVAVNVAVDVDRREEKRTRVAEQVAEQIDNS